ncbi:hypothetical protein V8F44DRAFT_602958 [Aspergillus fumigatus]
MRHHRRDDDGATQFALTANCRWHTYDLAKSSFARLLRRITIDTAYIHDRIANTL